MNNGSDNQEVDRHLRKIDQDIQILKSLRLTQSNFTKDVVKSSSIAPGGGSVNTLSVFCFVNQTTAQSIPDATDTAIDFEADISDPFNMHSTTTNISRITVPNQGLYLLGYKIASQNGSVGSDVKLVVNGTTNYVGGSMRLPQGGWGILSTCAFLNAGDYLQVTLNTNGSGADLTVVDGPNGGPNSAFWIVQIG